MLLKKYGICGGVKQMVEAEQKYRGAYCKNRFNSAAKSRVYRRKMDEFLAKQAAKKEKKKNL